MSETQSSSKGSSTLVAIVGAVVAVVAAWFGLDLSSGSKTPRSTNEPPSKQAPSGEKASPGKRTSSGKRTPSDQRTPSGGQTSKRRSDTESTDAKKRPAKATSPKPVSSKPALSKGGQPSGDAQRKNPPTDQAKSSTPTRRSRFDRSTSPGRNNRTANTTIPADGGAARIESLFRAKRSDAIVVGRGTVQRTLADDNEGSRHQKWILRLSNGRTILFAHNIDLAPRVPLDRGDEIEFHGEYEYNSRGGVIHWTHHDPRKRREDGWIRHRGKTYK